MPGRPYLLIGVRRACSGRPKPLKKLDVAEKKALTKQMDGFHFVS